jgi:hypothetical protein
MPEVDTALCEVVGRHLDRDAVAGKDTNTVLFHSTGSVGHDLVAIVEFHSTAGVWKDLLDDAFEFQHFFFCHSNS